MAVERQLNRPIQEFKYGKNEGSVMTALTVESLSFDEKQTSRSIRKELETSEVTDIIDGSNVNATTVLSIWRLREI
jgi:hypothetical protein